jgi:hypothetical protein
MKDLPPFLVRRSLPQIVDVEARPEGLRTWLQGGSFRVGSQSTTDHIILQDVQLSEFMPYQSYDFARFAFSSLETMAHCRSDPTRPKALSWPLLKAYYSGFFGAHAIMRALGQAVLRLEQSQTRTLSRIAALYSIQGLVITSGTFLAKIHQNSDRSIDLGLHRLTDAGGAHDSFWKRYKLFLEDLAIDVVGSGEPNSAALAATITELRDLTCREGSVSGAWLSNFRNKLNYQHAYGVWFPSSVSRPDAEYGARLGYLNTSAARFDFDVAREPVKAFCSTCLLISSVSFELTAHLCSRGTRSAFARNWRRLSEQLNS